MPHYSSVLKGPEAGELWLKAHDFHQLPTKGRQPSQDKKIGPVIHRAALQ
jgi:hypothetical protein